MNGPNFDFSVMVSAKDDDGSVDAAMKSLVRYLLDKSKFIQPKKSKEKKEKLKQKKNKPILSDYKNLSTVGIQEVFKMLDSDFLYFRVNVIRVFFF